MTSELTPDDATAAATSLARRLRDALAPAGIADPDDHERRASAGDPSALALAGRLRDLLAGLAVHVTEASLTDRPVLTRPTDGPAPASVAAAGDEVGAAAAALTEALRTHARRSWAREAVAPDGTTTTIAALATDRLLAAGGLVRSVEQAIAEAR